MICLLKGSTAVENAPPQKSSDIRLRIFCLWWAVQDSNRAALTRSGRVSNQPSGLLLSPRFPAARNVYQGRTNPILYEKGFGFVFVYRRFCDESTQEKEQALTYSGVLSLAGVVYSA